MVNWIFTNQRDSAHTAAGRAVAARGAALAICAVLVAAPATAQEECPGALVRELAPEAPECMRVGEGVLRSAQGNGDVAYRLYRWISTREEIPPPYNQVAVGLYRADRPDETPLWWSYYWLGEAWFETPYLATHPQWGEFLIVPGRYTGTGSFVEDRVLMPDHGRGWTEVRAASLDMETGDGWISGLKTYLPPGHGIWKGILVDYSTLAGTTRVWRDGDANCCPSGGEIRFRLGIAGDPPALHVESAEYLPPEQ